MWKSHLVAPPGAAFGATIPEGMARAPLRSCKPYVGQPGGYKKTIRYRHHDSLTNYRFGDLYGLPRPWSQLGK